MNKKFILFMIILIIICGVLPAEQLSKIGVVNFSKIIEDYFAESSAWREIDAIRAKYEAGKADIIDDIDQLKMEKLEAENNEADLLVLQLDNKIQRKQEYLKEYHEIWSNRINSKIENVSQSTTFTSEILDAIEYIAESEGYSLIFRIQDPNILWYNLEINITDKVLAHLRK